MYHVKVYSILTNTRHDYAIGFLFDAHKDFIDKPVYDYSAGPKAQVGTIVDAWLDNDNLCLLLRMCAGLLPLAFIPLPDIRFSVAWSMLIDAGTKQLERMNGMFCCLGSVRHGFQDEQQVTWTYVSSLKLLNVL